MYICVEAWESGVPICVCTYAEGLGRTIFSLDKSHLAFFCFFFFCFSPSLTQTHNNTKKNQGSGLHGISIFTFICFSFFLV